jgi:hypothetical protein
VQFAAVAGMVSTGKAAPAIPDHILDPILVTAKKLALRVFWYGPIPIKIAVLVLTPSNGWGGGPRAGELYNAADPTRGGTDAGKVGGQANASANSSGQEPDDDDDNNDSKATRGAVENERRKAVAQAWKQEQALVRATGQGTRQWTDKEIAELLDTGKVRGYQGHHINSVNAHPEMAGNPDNIKFTSEHLSEHGGNFRNATSGDLLDRSIP